MAVSEKKKAANAKWDKENMAYQTFTVRKSLLTEFKETVQMRGEKVNTLLREFLERYVRDFGVVDAGDPSSSPAPLPLPTGWAEQKPSVLRTLRTPDGWQLDVDDDGRAYGAWLTHSSCSVKVFLAGADKSKHTIDEFTSIILADIDAYKADYRHDYM